MKNQVYFGILWRILMLGIIGSLMTFIPDHLRTYFGDIPLAEGHFDMMGPDKYWEWGIRHYWYFWTMVLLFLLTLVNFIIHIARIINRNHPGLGAF